MIKKEKILQQIEELLNLEKRLIPLLNKHVSSTLPFSQINKNEQGKIIEQFQQFAVTKTRHLEVLGTIKQEIEKGKKDVY